MMLEGSKVVLKGKESMRLTMKTCLLFLCSVTITLGFQPSIIPLKLRCNVLTRSCQSQKAFSDLEFQTLSKERQQELTEIVAEGLVPVFFGRDVMMSGNNNNDNLRNQSPSNRVVTAEKALKMILRDYQKELSKSNNTSNPDTVEERRQTRKFLSDLLLGTSIMRIRHYYTLIAMLNKQGRNDGKDLADPINGLCLQDLGSIYGVDVISLSTEVEMAQLRQSLTVHGNTKNLELSRAMVQIHLQEMQEGRKFTSTITPVLSDFLASLKDPAHQVCIRYSLPLFFVQLLIDQYGCILTEQMAKTFNTPGPITIRRNAMRCRTNKQLQSLLSKHGIRSAPSIVPSKWNHQNATDALDMTYLQLVPDESWSPSRSSIWSQSLWKEGYFEVQDAGSQFIVQSTDDPTFANGEYVAVDYCAGNGGKSLALASHILQHLQEEKSGKNGGDVKATIISHDIVADRLKQLEGSLSRAGLQDASYSALQILTTTNLTDLANERGYPESFADLVLVDAPCSSTGVLRRRPSQRFQLQEDEIRNKFPELQLSILQEASKLVKVGGILVYATCSICDFENEQVVASFQTSTFYNEVNGKLWRPLCFAGKNQDESSKMGRRTSVEGLGHCCNLLPIGPNSSDGFFVARWMRVK